MKEHTERTHFFTSESVADGHPDKVADHISDAILDDIMAQDKECRVAVETLVSTGMAIVAGRDTTRRVLDFLYPDGKSQVTIEYKEGRPNRVEAVVVAAMHKDVSSHGRIKQDVIDEVILPSFPDGLIDKQTKFFVNETGKFVIGGPRADT